MTLIVLGLLAIVLMMRLANNGWFHLDTIIPQLSFYPILFILGGELSAIAFKWCLNIPQLTLFCFLLGSYGLLGLFITSEKWYRGLSIAIIFAFVLPFVTAFNSGLGFSYKSPNCPRCRSGISGFSSGCCFFP